MKVNFVMDSISRRAGGISEASRRLAQGLQARGDKVKVIGVCDADLDKDLVPWAPVSAVALRSHGPRRFGYAPKMAYHLSADEPDLVHSHGIWTYSSFVSLGWRRRTKRPEIVHPHGMLDLWALKNSAWKKRLIARIFEWQHLANASCLRALCQAELEAIRSYGLVNPVCIIPNGIDLLEFPQDFIHQPVLPKEKKILLYLGRLHPKKGLANLLVAWASLKSEQWVLAIAGWDEVGHEGELKRLADSLGLRYSDLRHGSGAHSHSTVIFMGPHFGEEKQALYRACDAFILPSFSEGMPMVILEAWVHEKPVVMTSMCNMPEGLAANAALEVDPEPESIKMGLQKLLALSDDQRYTMGQRGRELAGKKFTWDEVTNQMRSVQEWLVHGGNRPDCVYL